MNIIHINEELYKDLLVTEDKSIAQVIRNTEVLKEVYELLRFYIMEANNCSNEVKMKYYSRITEQIGVVNQSNHQARNLYRWLYNKDFEKSPEEEGSVLKNESLLLEELRTLVKKWDEDETDGELITEAIIAAFRFTKNISTNA